MAIQLSSTKNAVTNQGVKILVYGLAGAGKTTLCATPPQGCNPIIISAESGLMSLRDYDLPVISVNNIEEVYEAYSFLADSAEGKQYDFVNIDSITEIAEALLSSEKKKSADPRQAYGKLQEEMGDLLRAFRDLPERHVYMAAKMAKEKDELSGMILYQPMMPGAKLGQSIPYMFDEVFALRMEQDPEGVSTRWLQTSADPQYNCKDRSGCLNQFEEPNLGMIVNKITSATQNPKPQGEDN